MKCRTYFLEEQQGWFTEDKGNYEGLVNYIATWMLMNSNIKEVIDFEIYGIFKHQDNGKVGSMVVPSETPKWKTYQLTIKSLIEEWGEIPEEYFTEYSTEDTVTHLINIVEELFPTLKGRYADILSAMVQFDTAIMNTKRHNGEYGVIVEEDEKGNWVNVKPIPIRNYSGWWTKDLLTNKETEKAMLTNGRTSPYFYPFDHDYEKQFKITRQVSEFNLKFNIKPEDILSLEIPEGYYPKETIKIVKDIMMNNLVRFLILQDKYEVVEAKVLQMA